MRESGRDRRKNAYISQDCIDSARAAMKQDPDSQFVFVEGHAYQIKASATENDEAINLPIKARIAGREFTLTIPFPSRSVGELRKKVLNGDAEDITNFLKRLKKK